MFKVIPKRAHILVAMELWYVGKLASMARFGAGFNSTYLFDILTSLCNLLNVKIVTVSAEYEVAAHTSIFLGGAEGEEKNLRGKSEKYMQKLALLPFYTGIVKFGLILTNVCVGGGL